MAYLEYFDLFPQQCLGLGQVLLVYALHCHLPVMFLQENITYKFIFEGKNKCNAVFRVCVTLHLCMVYVDVKLGAF